MDRTTAQRLVWVIAAVVVVAGLSRFAVRPQVGTGASVVRCQSSFGDMVHAAQTLPVGVAASCKKAKMRLAEQAGIIAASAVVVNIVLQGALRLGKERRQ